MRNLGFVALIVAGVVAGAGIGGAADLSMIHPSLGAKTRFSLPVFERFGWTSETNSPSRSGELSHLTFNIDATKGDKRDTASSNPSPRGMGGLTASSCAMPAVGERKLAVLSVYEGDAISTVALGSRDVETMVVDIEIEAGDEPLYLVLSAFENMVWRFSGATSRVEKVVLLAADGTAAAHHRPVTMRDAERLAGAAARVAAGHRNARPMAPSERPFAGVVGIPSDIIITRNPSACFSYFSDPDSIQAARSSAIIRGATGRAPDVIAARYSVGAVRLPSGKATEGAWAGRAPEGFDQAMWRELLRFNPGGISRIDPDQVQSAVTVQSYDVLPQEAGLAQLIGSGQIIRLSDGLRIDKPIARFPAGLAGAHSVSFMLGAGVPMPAGDAGHSCVVDQDTGQAVVDGPIC
jgi:hypothetical protein